MNTRKTLNKTINNFGNHKLIKNPSKIIITQHKKQNNQNTTKNPFYYHGFVNEVTHLEMQMYLYMSKIYS